MESGLTLICPACGARTPFRRVHDDPSAPSVLWTCDSCGFGWDASALKVRADSSPWATATEFSGEDDGPTAPGGLVLEIEGPARSRISR